MKLNPHAYMHDTHKTYVIVGFSSYVGVGVPSRTRASPTTSSASSSLLSHSERNFTCSLESTRKGLFGESRFGHILVALDFVGVLNALAAEGDGARRKSLRGGVTGTAESVDESSRSTEAARAGWIKGCLLDGGGDTGALTR